MGMFSTFFQEEGEVWLKNVTYIHWSPYSEQYFLFYNFFSEISIHCPKIFKHILPGPHLIYITCSYQTVLEEKNIDTLAERRAMLVEKIAHATKSNPRLKSWFTEKEKKTPMTPETQEVTTNRDDIRKALWTTWEDCSMDTYNN